jgi:hypothetical protein
MIATGVLDYALTQELEEGDPVEEANDPDYGKTAT